MRILAALILLLAFALPAHASDICQGATCSSGEVGPFMQGISASCGNVGTCSLEDMVSVFHNIGNWILGIVGALVFFFYVYGGFRLILGGADENNIKLGKQAIRISTVGLIIVFVAYAGIQTLVLALQTGDLRSEEEGIVYVTCGPGSLNEGQPCGFNQVCTDDGRCISECLSSFGEQESEISNTLTYSYYACVNINDPEIASFEQVSGCQTDMCPGPAEVQCCQIIGDLN